ncbi:hypothetical protein [Oceanobacillus senegalensis]|nr:hypothetical protein [Oceanobacillus senegalensis]
MGKRSKSKRFIQQGADSVRKHAERFPYRSTLSERNREKNDTDTLGGF